MINRLGLVTCLSLAFACSREQPATPLPVPPDASGPLEIEWGGRLLRPWEIPRGTVCGGFSDELEYVGWGRNTGEFMFCAGSQNSDCAELCDFYRVGGAREHVWYGDAEPEEDAFGEVYEICDQPIAAFEHRLAAGDFHLDGDWAYGDDVVLVIAKELGEPDSEGLARTVVKIGARMRKVGASVAWVDRIDECEGDDNFCEPGQPIEFHLDAIAPSPDGQTIAVLAHTSLGHDFFTTPLHFLDAGMLADAARDAEQQ